MPEQHESLVVTLVTSHGCHFCAMADDTIRRLAETHPIRLRTVELGSEEGAALARRHRMPFPPLVLVDGRLHGHGRISEKKLRRELDAAIARKAG